jgi:lysophospholipase L1-like esterase
MKRFLCFGNSITASGGLSKGWATLLRKRLESEQPGQWEVIVKGVIGETSSQARERFDRDVVPALPAVVLCQFGINDANVLPETSAPRVTVETYRENLRFFAEAILQGGGTPVLIANHRIQDTGAFPQGNGRRIEENATAYLSIAAEVAGESGAGLIDIAADFDRRGVADYLAGDGVHLSLSGQAEYAEAVWRGLMSTGQLESEYGK